MSELDPHIDAKELAGFILCHVCQAYCDYERRIGLKCVCYPKRAFILCVGSPMDFLVIRATVANEMATLPPHLLGDTMIKVRDQFSSELQGVVNSGGQVDPYLFIFLRDLGQSMRSHTQDVD